MFSQRAHSVLAKRNSVHDRALKQRRTPESATPRPVFVLSRQALNIGDRVSQTLVMESDSASDVHFFSAEEDPKAAEQFAVTMGQGFANEPGNVIFCPNPDLYERRWRIIASNMLLRNPHTRMLYSVGPELGAVAMSYVYPDEKASSDQPDPPGLEDLSPLTRPEAVPVREDMFGFLDGKKAVFHETHGSFQYIAFLATRPSLRGKGYGSLLLRHLTRKADEAGRWCYLEASNADNARLYERHGFRRLQEPQVWTLESVPGKAMTLIPMARPPTTRGSVAAGAE